MSYYRISGKQDGMDYGTFQADGEEQHCPNCHGRLVHANCYDGTIDTYCADCGWPDECLEPAPGCAVCGRDGVGTCGAEWRCDEHWLDDSDPADESLHNLRA